jgi:pimeloyl-ACP methyl ester carboxylesterase
MRAFMFLFLLTALGAAQSALEDRMINVSGVSLHIRCGGERRPTAPVVLLEAGGGNTADAWRPVHAPIAQFARVCAHDRPGSGTSGPAPDWLTTGGYIDLLRDLLKAAGEPPPYVMVGHSMGGLIVSLYAVNYPSDIAGLVLVDSSHEDQLRRFAALPRPSTAAAAAALPAPPGGISFFDFLDALRKKPWHGTVPLVVLTRARSVDANGDPNVEARRALWMELQRDLATRSPKSEHIVAQKSGHQIQRDEPQLVIDAVRRVLEMQ